MKGLVVFYIFQRLIHIFKDEFTKFQDKRHFFKFQEFSRTKVKFKDFSRSVRTQDNKKLSPKINVKNIKSVFQLQLKTEPPMVEQLCHLYSVSINY